MHFSFLPLNVGQILAAFLDTPCLEVESDGNILWYALDTEVLPAWSWLVFFLAGDGNRSRGMALHDCWVDVLEQVSAMRWSSWLEQNDAEPYSNHDTVVLNVPSTRDLSNCSSQEPGPALFDIFGDEEEDGSEAGHEIYERRNRRMKTVKFRYTGAHGSGTASDQTPKE